MKWQEHFAHQRWSGVKFQKIGQLRLLIKICLWLKSYKENGKGIYIVCFILEISKNILNENINVLVSVFLW